MLSALYFSRAFSVNVGVINRWQHYIEISDACNSIHRIAGLTE